MDSIANGGIQDGVYEHYGPADAAGIQAMCELMASALLPGPPPIFQRGRWMRNTKPAREITLILSFGDAGTEALTLWMRRHSKTDAMVLAGNFRVSLGIMYDAIARKDQSGHHELAAVVEGEVHRLPERPWLAVPRAHDHVRRACGVDERHAGVAAARRGVGVELLRAARGALERGLVGEARSSASVTIILLI